MSQNAACESPRVDISLGIDGDSLFIMVRLRYSAFGRMRKKVSVAVLCSFSVLCAPKDGIDMRVATSSQCDEDRESCDADECVQIPFSLLQ